MKKLLGMVALATALLVAQGASAASVDIVAAQSAPGSNSWSLSVHVTANLGGLSLLTGSNTTSFTASAAVLPLLDGGLTGLFENPLADPPGSSQILSVTNGTGSGTPPPGLIICASGATCLIGTIGTSGGLLTLANNDELNGSTAYGAPDGGVILDYSITVTPAGNPIPEPASMMLMALGLAGLAVARRTA